MDTEEAMLNAIREIGYALINCHDIPDRDKKAIFEAIDNIRTAIDLQETK